MLSVHLVRLIEQHAEQLTETVLDDLGSNPRTASYHTLSREELHRRAYEVFRNFTRWLSYETDEAMESWYGELGRERYAEGVPLNELIYALVLTKYHLMDYVRSMGLADSALELYQELEILRLIGRFFDKAYYYAVKGHEQEAAAQADAGVAR